MYSNNCVSCVYACVCGLSFPSLGGKWWWYQSKSKSQIAKARAVFLSSPMEYPMQVLLSFRSHRTPALSKQSVQ